MKTLLSLLIFCHFNLSLAQQNLVEPEPCHLSVQVLGSGGPELTKNRASSSYLVWLNGKAVLLVDAGGGSSFRFGQSDAQWYDLEAVLFTHFHADHSGDFAAMIKASWFGNRNKDLPVFGPYGNDFMPSTTEFINTLFGNNKGAFKYLSDFYDNHQEVAEYRLSPHIIKDSNTTQKIFSTNRMTISAQKVEHGAIPAFAYIVNTCDKTIVFSGDTNSHGFENLKLNKTDIFIAHNAIPQNAGRVAKYLHMTPLQIGQLATHLNTQKLVLSHRMNRSLGKEDSTLKEIQKNFNGKIEFADDLAIFKSYSLEKNKK